MKTLKINQSLMRGDDVKKCQNLLVKHGYKLGKWGVDGIYGKDTESAVKAFQKARGLVVDGIVGEKTWAALRSNPASGSTARTLKHTLINMSGPDVAECQRLLVAWGMGKYLGKAGVDGKYGSGTKKGVLEYQKGMSLAPDGICGPATWAALRGEVVENAFSDEGLFICGCDGKYCKGLPSGGISVGLTLLLTRLQDALQAVYSDKGIRVYIRSSATKYRGNGGYRCPTWNSMRGGASGSQHKYGAAADIFAAGSKAHTDSVLRAKLEQLALDMNPYGGVGYGDSVIVHVDTRGQRARWKY